MQKQVTELVTLWGSKPQSHWGLFEKRDWLYLIFQPKNRRKEHVYNASHPIVIFLVLPGLCMYQNGWTGFCKHPMQWYQWSHGGHKVKHTWCSHDKVFVMTTFLSWLHQPRAGSWSKKVDWQDVWWVWKHQIYPFLTLPHLLMLNFNSSPKRQMLYIEALYINYILPFNQKTKGSCAC